MSFAKKSAPIILGLLSGLFYNRRLNQLITASLQFILFIGEKRMGFKFLKLKLVMAIILVLIENKKKKKGIGVLQLYTAYLHQ